MDLDLALILALVLALELELMLGLLNLLELNLALLLAGAENLDEALELPGDTPLRTTSPRGHLPDVGRVGPGVQGSGGVYVPETDTYTAVSVSLPWFKDLSHRLGRRHT